MYAYITSTSTTTTCTLIETDMLYHSMQAPRITPFVLTIPPYHYVQEAAFQGIIKLHFSLRLYS